MPGTLSTEEIKKFRRKIGKWYLRNGRHDLPWRSTRDPYRILVSEVMLQQTQVGRALSYYERFLKRFPRERELAQAPLGDVLAVWSGLGYNRRAKFLQEAAFIALREWGSIPCDSVLLESLPGVGHYTAQAVACFSGAASEPFLETNIRRVVLHEFFPRKRNVSDKTLLACLTHIEPKNALRRDWYLALMDYGAITLKDVPNPNRRSKHYVKQSKFEGSLRQVRGQVIRTLLAHPQGFTMAELEQVIQPVSSRTFLPNVLLGLAKEGMILCAKSLTRDTKCSIVTTR